MIRFIASMWLLLCAAPLVAQIVPQPGPDTPRVQTVSYIAHQQVLLTMLPDTPITVMLEPGELIADVRPQAGDDFRIRVSSERNSFMILPTRGAQSGLLEVSTPAREYSFMLRVDQGYGAALLVRFVGEQAVTEDYSAPSHPTQTWLYRLRGDREVRPESLSDDGIKTRITYAPGQALPAVFAIGPTGDEEVVNGYMRDGVFILDRVYEKLVFRIDREKATARRNKTPEEAS